MPLDHCHLHAISPTALEKVNISPVLQAGIWNYLLELLNQFLGGRKYVNIILNRCHFPKRWNAGCGTIATEENSLNCKACFNSFTLRQVKVLLSCLKNFSFSGLLQFTCQAVPSSSPFCVATQLIPRKISASCLHRRMPASGIQTTNTFGVAVCFQNCVR